MLTPTDVAKAVHVVRASGAAEILRELMPKRKAGRPTALTEELFLIGSVLSALEGEGMVLTDVYSVLTERMDRDWQVRLGIRETIAGKPAFSQDAVHRFSGRLSEHLEFGLDSAPTLSSAERAHRRDGTYRMLYALTDETLIETNSLYRSIDSTGIWSWGRNQGNKGLAALLKELEALKAEGRDDEHAYLAAAVDRLKVELDKAAKAGKKTATSSVVDPAADPDPSAESEIEDDSGRRPYDPDARSGAKTAKNGATEWFYGYSVHAVARVAEPGREYTSEPNLIERFVVAPGVRELVDSSNQLLDGLRAENGERLVILGDRAYSNLTEDNWYHRLREKGFTQVVDMREEHQTWTDVDGMRVTAGWPHCPATPDRFESIVKPIQGREEFHAQIAERQQYAMGLHAQSDTGRRFKCPALCGTVRCALRPETMASRELPLVENPPDAATAPKCCTAQTVTVRMDDPNARARLWQDDYWGTPEHTRKMNRRTSIEQAFSKLKSPDMHGMSRGFVRVAGLARVTLAVGMIIVAHNIRVLETFAERHNDEARAADHPLMQPRDEHVVLHLDQDEAAAFAAFRAARGAAGRKPGAAPHAA